MPLQTTRNTKPPTSTSPPITTRLRISSRGIRYLRVLGAVHHPYPAPVTRSRTCEEKWTIPGPWEQTLLSVLDVTSVRMILPNKKGLEGRLNLLLEGRTLLIGVHVFERVP